MYLVRAAHLASALSLQEWETNASTPPSVAGTVRACNSGLGILSTTSSWEIVCNRGMAAVGGGGCT